MGTSVIEQLRMKAGANPQRVAFPEATEEKILRAARQVKDEGIAHPKLVGNPEAIAQAAQAAGIPLDGMEVINIADAAGIERLSDEYVRANPDYPLSAAKRMLRTPLNYAAMMVRFGDADCIVAGLTHTTGEVIIASEMIIGLMEGISTVSSMALTYIPGYDGPEGNLLGMADCAVVPDPDPEQLADIAIATADTIRSLMGWEPRVALLSFSTKGSTGHERVDTVLKALDLARERRPDLLIDGELQLDSAIVPDVAAKKVKEESPVAGRANILIFPDLNAGNIGVKLLQRFAGAVAYGPMLQGFAKPVCDLSRGAPLEEIVGAITMVCVRAQTA